MNCSPPGSSVRGISQKRILEWVAISFSRGSSGPRDGTCVSCLAGGFFTTEPPWKPIRKRTILSSIDKRLLAAKWLLWVPLAVTKACPVSMGSQSSVPMRQAWESSRLELQRPLPKHFQVPLQTSQDGLEHVCPHLFQQTPI